MPVDRPYGAEDPQLIEMFRSIVKKSRQDIPQPQAQASSIAINFDGGGVPLVAGLGGIAEVRFPCRIMSCHVFSGSTGLTGIFPVITTSATVYLGLAEQGHWASGSQALYGTGSPPGLIAASEEDSDIEGWTTDLQPGDLIAYTLVEFTGTATFISVSLPIRRLDVSGIGVAGVSDSGDTVTDDTVPVTLRG